MVSIRTGHRPSIVIGGGVTGLAAGLASGSPVFEATDRPGGLCASYYVRPGDDQRRLGRPRAGDAYRFEVGGGHWIFGGDPIVMRFLGNLAELRHYTRKSAVYFVDSRLSVPYPIQNHLHVLGRPIAQKAAEEMRRAHLEGATVTTLRQWLRTTFGKTLDELFFRPFHQLYLAGLDARVEPQDPYKSPVDLRAVQRGVAGPTPSAGYNVRFAYPRKGLDELSNALAKRCDFRPEKRVVAIDRSSREVEFADGDGIAYSRLISTLPLHQTLGLAGLEGAEEAISTSVLVVNIGAIKGPQCPEDHWLYLPQSSGGFHRLGIYSNVEQDFLPRSSAANVERVSFYAERSFVGGSRPSQASIDRSVGALLDELTALDFASEFEVVDPTWIEVAYTWNEAGSRWRRNSLTALEQCGIVPVGRYARWKFQGIAESVRDGMVAGTCVRSSDDLGDDF